MNKSKTTDRCPSCGERIVLNVICEGCDEKEKGPEYCWHEQEEQYES